MSDERARVRIYYDGACPFCRNYVSLVRLRENFDVELVDVRTRPETVKKFAEEGFDLSDGMIAEFPGSTHYGADAVTALSLVSSSKGPLNAALATVFRHPRLASALYPAMKLGRRVTLAALGIPARLSPDS